MIVEYLALCSFQGVAVCLLSLISIKTLVNRFGGGLNKIPGPFLAGFTDFWRVVIVWRRRPELTHIQLHEKYGPVVRIGPRTVSVGDVQAVKKIYALNAGFIKVCPNRRLPRYAN